MAQTPPDASLDAETDLKKRARRRLVGAAALALLAAVVLPMVMDHQPKPEGQDIQVRIPSQDGSGFVSRIIPGKPAATPLPPAPAAKPAAEPAKEAVVEAPKPEAPKAEPQKAEPPKAEAPKAEPAKPETPKPTAKPAPVPAKSEKPADKAKPADARASKAEEARATAALTGGAPAAEQWVVQLGAYKEAGHVKLLLAKIKQMGLPVYTEEFASPAGQRTRVRAGPFASREAAEKAKARIKSIGVDGPVAPK